MHCGISAGSNKRKLFSNLPQDLGGMLAEPRRGPLVGHRPPADHERRTHARDRAALGMGARQVELDAAVLTVRLWSSNVSFRADGELFFLL